MYSTPETHVLFGGRERPMTMLSRSFQEHYRGVKAARTRRDGTPIKHPQHKAFNAAKRAIRSKDFGALTKLVRAPGQANWYANDRAWCLLDEAVRANSAAMVKWLLEKGANPNTLFFGDTRINLSDSMECGMYFSPLASAISDERDAIVEVMLAHGADLGLPVLVYEPGHIKTCHELAIDCGMLPRIEAFLLARATSAPPEKSCRPTRL